MLALGVNKHPNAGFNLLCSDVDDKMGNLLPGPSSLSALKNFQGNNEFCARRLVSSFTGEMHHDVEYKGAVLQLEANSVRRIGYREYIPVADWKVVGCWWTRV